MDSEVGRTIGHYLVRAKLGSGGMGEVFSARDTRLGREVALKLLPRRFTGDPDRLARFEREARAASALNHPNIVTVHEVGEEDGVPYMVMERVKGQTLRHLTRGKPLPIRRALDVAVQAAEGLARAHASSIVHRDLKPENVMVTDEGLVKILDFGLAKLVAPDSDPEARVQPTSPETSTPAELPLGGPLSRPGAVRGTAGYMSPEQAKGDAVDFRSDQFAFGTILYETVTGCRAFHRGSPVQTLAAIIEEEPEPITRLNPGVPAPFRWIVERCLAKEPQDRYASTLDLARELKKVREHLDEALSLRGSWSLRDALAGSSVRRRPWSLVATGVAVALVAALAFLWRGQHGDELGSWTARQLTNDPGWDGEPALSPDGSLVAFVSDRTGNEDIWVVDVRGGDPLRLTTHEGSDRSPTWFPDGCCVAFVSNRGGRDDVWRVPRLGGSAVLVLPDAYDPAISPDGTRVAFARAGDDALSRIGVAPLDDPERAMMLTEANDGLLSHRQPAWSPDGSRICYRDFSDLWLVPASGGEPKRLTEDDPPDRDPAWSADGHHIYFASIRQGNFAIWRRALDGTPMTRTTSGTAAERWPSPSRDGRSLAYSTSLKEHAIAILDRTTGERSSIRETRPLADPAIVPDRSGVVFCSARDNTVDLWWVALVDNRPTGEPRRVTHLPGRAANPAISPDSRWVAFQRVLEGQRDVWVAPLTGGPARNVSDHTAIDIHPQWSPDGRALAFSSDRAGSREIWVADMDGGRRVGSPRQVTTNSGSASHLGWAPDGSRLAYLERTGDECDVWLVAVRRGGSSQRLTRGAQADELFWSPATDELLVLGRWGGTRPSIRAVDPRTGDSRPFTEARPASPMAWVENLHVSLDGELAAWTETTELGDVWLLEPDTGSP